MVDLIRRYATIGLAICAIAVLPQVVQAQIMPDGTLPTRVGSRNGLDFAIEGGSRSGNNLFHSFSQFSVPTGGSAIFNNATDIQNIFSRVTGGAGSNIDGLIQTQGSANLFLLNPSGLLFGPNAKLNIGGSFLGTTASSIKFADGVEFSATNPTPLLTMSVPIGLQMGTNPGSIQVNGTGHRLASASATTSAYLATGSIDGLKVKPGQTLALVGGDLTLTGGALTAERGRIELGSIGPAVQVRLDTTTPILKLDYTAVPSFQNISLANRSIVDVSGAGAGSIQVQGQQVRLTDGSLLFIQNRGPQTAGDIQVGADSLEVLGGIASTNIRSAIVNETRSGNTGNIVINTRKLDLINGGSLFTRSFGVGAGGTIDVNAREAIKMDGFLATNTELISTIATVSFSPLITGRSGSINITSPDLSLQNGAIITGTTFGNAAAGNITVNADRVEVAGISPSSFGPTAISSSSFGKGNAGTITVNASTLLVKNFGTINTTSSNSGDAGSIVINASQGVEVTGGYLSQKSNIGSGVNLPNPAIRALLRLPSLPTGNAGSVTINSPTVRLADQGRIGVRNNGLGNSGKVLINANQILLDETAQISATTDSGEGGNVLLNSQLLVLRRGSNITASAGGIGNGGNISLQSPLIVGLEDSDVIASAVKGRGGSINITTQGILGLKYRDRLTPANDITASSEFGVNGTVQVNTIGVDPNSGLTSLPVDIVDPSQKIATGCTDQTTSSFVATGRGGIPENPMQSLNGDRVWRDLRDVAVAGTTKPAKSSIAPAQFAEATAWQINPQGQPELIDQGLNSMSKGDRISCAK
jgi:filamentous hemagglutinin family protein